MTWVCFCQVLWESPLLIVPWICLNKPLTNVLCCKDGAIVRTYCTCTFAWHFWLDICQICVWIQQIMHNLFGIAASILFWIMQSLISSTFSLRRSQNRTSLGVKLEYEFWTVISNNQRNWFHVILTSCHLDIETSTAKETAGCLAAGELH